MTRVQYGIKPVIADRRRSGRAVGRVHDRLDELEAALPSASESARRRRGGNPRETPASTIEADKPSLVGDRLELRVVVDGMQFFEYASLS